VNLVIEMMGWLSAALILSAYLLVSTGKLGGQSGVFQWMNVAGSLGMMLNTAWHGAIPSVVLNAAWMLIGLFALWKIRQHISST